MPHDGIWGNAKEEAIYPGYYVDDSVQPLDGSKARFELRFPTGGLSPASALWSLTMYAAPSHLLVANPIDRYLVNSPMLPELKRDPKGGLTLYVQHAPPGADRAANWLPAPAGPFLMALRIYWPKPEALDGTRKRPPVQRVN